MFRRLYPNRKILTEHLTDLCRHSEMYTRPVQHPGLNQLCSSQMMGDQARRRRPVPEGSRGMGAAGASQGEQERQARPGL